jgi:peptidoglycan hydrolase CwlO-like protein
MRRLRIWVAVIFIIAVYALKVDLQPATASINSRTKEDITQIQEEIKTLNQQAEQIDSEIKKIEAQAKPLKKQLRSIQEKIKADKEELKGLRQKKKK